MDALEALKAMRNSKPTAEPPKATTQAEVLGVLDREIAGAGRPAWQPVLDPQPSPLCVPPSPVWVVAENNPYQRSAAAGLRYAMYPDPPKSAGARFCLRILGMGERDYLRAFERRNLLARPTWSAPLARAAAACLSWEWGPGERVILLGKRVWLAFFGDVEDPEGWAPFTAYQREVRCGTTVRFLALPHPSGMCQVWNGKDPRWPKPSALAREAVRQLAPHLAPLLATGEATWGRTVAEINAGRGA